MKKINTIVSLLLLIGMTGCFDLDKNPEGVLSTANPFKTTGEIEKYIYQFYESGVRTQALGAGGGSGITGTDTNSDNLASSAVVLRTDGGLSLANATSLSQYTYIRNVNFLLNNLDNYPDPSQTNFKHLVGEAYYFRAWYYYQLLINYGPVAIVEVPLDPIEEVMNYKRNSRTEVADFIIADLEKAIENLQVQNNSSSMRVHKDVARALLSEVALFEGTWEKYHKAANTAFYDKGITDTKIKDYFQKAADAAKAVIDRNIWQIYSTGNKTNDYRVIFATTNLSNNPEILWYKRYDGDQIGNSVNRYLNMGGGGFGVTASLVDDYLTIDGRPFLGEEKLNAKKIYGNELLSTIRDPRLSQTVATPGQKMRPDQPAYTFPPLIGKGAAYNQNTTGYSLLKHTQIDYTGDLDAEEKGATPAIQFRYADILLNYAEALAELDGAANAGKIISAIQPLRDRVGMPAMDFDREYNTANDYPFKGLNKYIQAVRRERRVEQAVEGRRLTDILRWAAADVLIAGQWPKGALFIGSNLEHVDFGGNIVIGQNLFVDEKGNILPINPLGHENGYGFRVDRDYLLPIEERMISLTDNLWEQNPGW